MYARASTKATEVIKANKEVRGVTVLNSELFLVYDKSTKVQLYDGATLERNQHLSIAGLNGASDLKSNDADGFLYIADDEGPEGLPCVHRVDVNADDSEESTSPSNTLDARRPTSHRNLLRSADADPQGVHHRRRACPQD